MQVKKDAIRLVFWCWGISDKKHNISAGKFSDLLWCLRTLTSKKALTLGWKSGATLCLLSLPRFEEGYWNVQMFLEFVSLQRYYRNQKVSNDFYDFMSG